MDNLIETKHYFDDNYERLRRIKDTTQKEIAYATRLSLEHKLRGRVLDIGSCGNIDYSLNGIERLILIDVSRAVSNCVVQGKINALISDARHLSIEDNVFDCVVILHTLHHLAGTTLRETSHNVERCIQESYRVLRSGGRLFVIDAFCARYAQAVENTLFRMSFLIFNLLGKPMVHYFSFGELMTVLEEAGFQNTKHSYLDTGNARLCPFNSSRGVPFKYLPISHILIEAIKKLNRSSV